MRVILNKDIANLGEEGDIVDVKRGYARNYLIPQSLVMPYNEQALAILETHKAAIEKRKEEKRKSAMDLKSRLESEPLEIAMTAGRNGKLFGSVTAAGIADALAKIGVDVEKKRISVPDNSLKTLGNYVVDVKLYGATDAQVRVSVVAHGAPVEEEVPAEAETAEASVSEAGAEQEAPAESAAEEAEAAEAAEAPAEEAVTEEAEGTDGSAEADEEADDTE